MSRWLYFMLVFAALAVVLDYGVVGALHVEIPPWVVFITAALGIIPLAALIGKSVEEVAEHTGERIGGMLFATFGNAAELIISILALSKGLVDVVSASIIGSVIGNVLLVLGISICVGCLKHGRLRFEARPAGQYAALLALSIGGLLLPTIAELLATRLNLPLGDIKERGVLLSDFIAVLLLMGYVASILFSVFRIGDKGGDEQGDELEPFLGARSEAAIDRLLTYRHRIATSGMPNKSGLLSHIDVLVAHEAGQAVAAVADNAPEQPAQPAPVQAAHAPAAEHKAVPLWQGLLMLTLATIGVAILSEILVGAIEPMAQTLGWNEAFVGLIFLPLIGGIAEYINTIKMALDKRMGMVLAASAGSSIQIALLMAPILVLASLFTRERLDLVFNLVELSVLALATFLYSEITKDGELVWLEGLLLILLYAMMGGTVFLFSGV
jgi:Ca2+:H+ antiporter